MSNSYTTDQDTTQAGGGLPPHDEAQPPQSYQGDSGASGLKAPEGSHVYHPYDLAKLSTVVRSPTRGFYSGNSLLYSTSGFDMISVIARVVVDPYTPDHAIVYCSSTFCQLTRYSPDDILNKNCRFLQSPDGIVEQGSVRKHTDHEAVMHFKDATVNHRELKSGQVSLINYKKGGEPFLNLVTVVPITWDSDKIRYHVGFQADLVEAPRQLMENVRLGRYTVNSGPARW